MPDSARDKGGGFRPPHPAAVPQHRAPHAATIVQPKRSFAAGRLHHPPPHPATRVGGSARSLGEPGSPTAAFRSDRLPLVSQRMQAPVKVLETTKHYRIEYDPSTRNVNLFSAEGTLLAHVFIQLDDDQNQLVLHTHTDDPSGAVGGRGFMAALTMAVLKTVATHFSTYASVSMTPAVGAATKGLVSQLCGAFVKKMPFFSSKVYGPTTNTAKDLRDKRKKDGPSGSGANDWDNALMLETMYELLAMQQMEAVLHTGICILGMGPKLIGNIVGNGQLGAHFGWPTYGALNATDWYADAAESSGTLTFMIPMKFIQSLFSFW